MTVEEHIAGQRPDGAVVVLATITQPGMAACANPGCGTQIQRSSNGDLRDGVRAHYKTVHPERNLR